MLYEMPTKGRSYAQEPRIARSPTHRPSRKDFRTTRPCRKDRHQSKEKPTISNLKRRIERVEQQILGEDDEIITIDWLSGPCFQMTMGEFRQLLRDAEGTRHYPGMPISGHVQTDRGETEQP